MKRRKAHSLQISIIATIVVLFVLAFLLVFQNNTYNQVKKGQQTIYSRNIDGYFDSMYEEASVLGSIATILESNYEVLRIANTYDSLSEQQRQQYYVDVIKTLKDYRSITNIIYDISIYFEEHLICLSSSGSATSFENYNEIIKDIDQLFYEKNGKINFSRINKNENFAIIFTIDNYSFFYRINSFVDFEKDLISISVGNANYNNKVDLKKINLSYEKSLYGITITSSSFSKELYTLSVLSSVVFVSLVIVGLGACLISIFMVKYRAEKLFIELSKGFLEIENENYNYRIVKKLGKDNEELIESFNKMSEQLKTYFESNYKHELLLKEAENKKLQSQINPHFLHNTYFFLRKEIIQEHYAEAEEFAFDLSQFFKYITYPKEKVELYLEYQHAINYLNIQNKRLKNRVNLKIDEVPLKYKNLMVPFLIIEPIVENSFKYVFEKDINKATLYLFFKEENNKLVLYIEDSGNISDDNYNRIIETLQLETKNEVFSCLKNIKTRLKYFGGDLTVYKSKDNGLGVKMILGGDFDV